MSAVCRTDRHGCRVYLCRHVGCRSWQTGGLGSTPILDYDRHLVALSKNETTKNMLLLRMSIERKSTRCKLDMFFFVALNVDFPLELQMGVPKNQIVLCNILYNMSHAHFRIIKEKL